MLATTSSPSWRRRTAACCGPSTPGATMPSTKVRSTADRSPFHVGARPGKYRSSRSIPQRVSSDLEASPGQGGGADAGLVGRDRWDQGNQQVPELGVVLLEDPDHLGVRDRLHAGRALQTDVV